LKPLTSTSFMERWNNSQFNVINLREQKHA
jgi:hypothetical protein